MQINEKLKELRHRKGLTLEQVGKAVGVGKSTVRKWENVMIKNMGQDKISKLAFALGTTPDFLTQWNLQEEFICQKEHSMKSNLTDEEVDLEIARLASDPDVKLAVAERNFKSREKYKRRQKLYSLRNLKKHGSELREAGITREMLSAYFNDPQADENYDEETYDE